MSYLDWELQFRGKNKPNEVDKEAEIINDTKEINNGLNSLGIREDVFKESLRKWKKKNNL